MLWNNNEFRIDKEELNLVTPTSSTSKKQKSSVYTSRKIPEYKNTLINQSHTLKVEKRFVLKEDD